MKPKTKQKQNYNDKIELLTKAERNKINNRKF